MNPYKFTVRDKNGIEYRNLRGVFVRVFPIVTARVNGNSELSEYVYYHGERYEIKGISNN